MRRTASGSVKKVGGRWLWRVTVVNNGRPTTSTGIAPTRGVAFREAVRVMSG